MTPKSNVFAKHFKFRKKSISITFQFLVQMKMLSLLQIKANMKKIL